MYKHLELIMFCMSVCVSLHRNQGPHFSWPRLGHLESQGWRCSSPAFRLRLGSGVACDDPDGGFLKWGYPNSWMVMIMENPEKKWIGEYPYFRKPPNMI